MNKLEELIVKTFPKWGESKLLGEIVAREQVLREEIDKIIAEIEG